MKKPTHLMKAAFAATAVITLAACSGGAESTDAPTLQLVQSGDAAQGGAYQALADRYFEETGVTVQVVEVPSDDLATRLRNGAQANDLPAMAAAPNVDPVWMERLLDLTEIATEARVLPTLNVEDPADGKVKTLPTTLTSVGMFLNKSLWDAAGVTYPADSSESWTWDEFVAKGEEVVEATDAGFGLVVDASAHRLRSFLYEFGSEGVVDDNGTYVTNDATATALEYFKELNDNGFMPKSVWTAGDDPSSTFKSGRVAAYYSGVWQIADFQANITDFEWVSVPTPQQPVKATNYGAASWLVAFDGTGVEQESLDFISWLYSPENYLEYCEISGCLPAVEDIEMTYPANSEAFELYNDEISASPAVSAVQTTDQLLYGYRGKHLDYEPLKDETVKYLNGEQTVDETIANILAATQSQLG